jgi:hypothetical protein
MSGSIFIFNQAVNDGVHPVFYWLSLTIRGKSTPLIFGELGIIRDSLVTVYLNSPPVFRPQITQMCADFF